MKEKVFWMGLIIVLISMIGNLWYLNSKQLKEPVFLNHFLANDVFDKNSTVPLTFYYITNKHKPIYVSDVYIDGVEVYTVDNNQDYWSNNQHMIHSHQEFAHYSLVSVHIEILAQTIPFDNQESWSFSTMEVSFSNGSTKKVSIGQVLLTQYIEHGSDYLINNSVTSGNDGFGSTTFTTTKPLEIISIDSPFVESLDDELAVKVSASDNSVREGKRIDPDWLKNENFNEWQSKKGTLLSDSLEPFKIDRGEEIYIFTQIRPFQTSVFGFPLEIRGRTDSGDMFVTKALVNNDIHLNQKSIEKIISSKVAGDN